ncbi:MAG: integrase core domain-containing protein [Pseudomonadaceae bacterium]|nr:integrase core domain-containing protein [Pseudomonadaceae bacterium]
MKIAFLLTIHILVVVAKMLRPGGIKAIIAENLLLKHQLTILSRSRQKAPNLKTTDRFILGGLSLFISASRRLSVAVTIQPSTLLTFHRALVKRKYRRLFNNKGHRRPGPKGPSRELIAAIVELKQRNPRYGCPRIAYIVSLTFGFEINKDAVRRVLAKHYKPKPGNTQGPSWLSLLDHSKDSLWSIDLFRCESLTLKSYWVLVVMDQYSRRIIGFGIHHGDVDGINACRMSNHAISESDPPRYLSSDNDPLFRFHRWRANLRILEVTEIKSIPYAPMSHPFIERVISTIRREYLDHVPFGNSLDLERKLDEFKDYYNNHRTHAALSGLSPAKFGQQANQAYVNINDYGWQQHCRGLFHTPIPA